VENLMKICQAFILDEEEGQLLFHAFLVNNTCHKYTKAVYK
jgi:hypothetical protein